MKKFSLCHQYQEYFKYDEIQESFRIADLVSNDQIVAIAGENSYINTVRFVIEVKFVDRSSNNVVDYGHIVPKSQPYLLWNYLEKINDNKKGVVYQRSKKNFFLYKESIVYPLIEFEPNYNKKRRFIFS